MLLLQVMSGRLLMKWHAHYRAVTCLVFSEDDSLLISGSEDGCVRVWSLLKYKKVLSFSPTCVYLDFIVTN